MIKLLKGKKKKRSLKECRPICLRKIWSIFVHLGISYLGVIVKVIMVQEEVYRKKIKGLKAKI